LNGDVVLVQSNAFDPLSLLGRDNNGEILPEDFGAGVSDGFAQGLGRALEPYPREVRPKAAAPAIDGVTPDARALPFKDGLAGVRLRGE
jgi:hypothetical protein